MRILMVAESRTYHAQRWTSALASRGHRVWLLSRSQVPITGVDLIPLRTPSWGWRYPGGWQRRYQGYLRDVILRVRPDVVHVHFLENLPLSEKVLGGVRLVVSTWGSDVIPDFPEECEPADQRACKVELLRRADQVTATTHFLAGETARYGGMSPADIEVIPFGVDLTLFWPRTGTGLHEPPRMIFLKHLFPKYGPEYMVQSLPEIVASVPGARVSMVGEGPMLAALRAQAEELGVMPAIDWCGPVAHARVPSLLAKHDVYVMPSVSRSETFGVAAVEAQAAEVPVVFTDLPGVCEAVRDGVGGIKVPPEDPGALARAVIRLLTDAELNRRMGRAGAEFVARRFDWHENVSAMEHVYDRVVNRDGGRHVGGASPALGR